MSGLVLVAQRSVCLARGVRKAGWVGGLSKDWRLFVRALLVRPFSLEPYLNEPALLQLQIADVNAGDDQGPFPPTFHGSGALHPSKKVPPVWLVSPAGRWVSSLCCVDKRLSFRSLWSLHRPWSRQSAPLLPLPRALE